MLETEFKHTGRVYKVQTFGTLHVNNISQSAGWRGSLLCDDGRSEGLEDEGLLGLGARLDAGLNSDLEILSLGSKAVKPANSFELWYQSRDQLAQFI
jgi:hypothetical protein